MMDIAQIAAAAGTFIGSTIAAILARRASKRSEKVEAEMLGPGDEPSLRQMLLDQNKAIDRNAATAATEFARTHRDSGEIMGRVTRLETRVDKLESKVHKG